MILKSKTTTLIYAFCLDYAMEHERFPTQVEVGKYFGFTREYARQELDKLAEIGYLEKLNNKNGGYNFRVIDHPAITKSMVRKIKNVINKNHYAEKNGNHDDEK